MARPGLEGAGTTRVEGPIDGEPFLVVLRFGDEGVLAEAALLAAHPRFGTSWADADLEAQRAFHDAWLTARLGADRARPWRPESYPYGSVEWRLPWGTAGSYMHPKDGNAEIVLTYR